MDCGFLFVIATIIIPAIKKAESAKVKECAGDFLAKWKK